MPHKRYFGSASIFNALPVEIKRTLRSQPSVNEILSTRPAGPAHEPRIEDLLPTQPPGNVASSVAAGDSDDEGSGSDMDIADESEHAEDHPEPPVVQATTLEPQLAPPPIAPASTSVVKSIKRAASTEFNTPAKRRKGKGKATESSNPYEGHAWDCTGLVPRYTEALEVPKHLKKYFFQRHSLFPSYTRLPLLLDDTGWFSVTPASIAEHIAERCRSDVVVDAFCGVGGNAIAFARTCERVIALDNDPVRLRLARHNALHHGVADRIEFVLGDYVAWAREYARTGASAREAVDVVFLSPPWGGIEYLSVGDKSDGAHPAYPLSAILPIPGDELFRLTTPISPNIAYFLPRNVDVDEVAALAVPLAEAAHDTEDGSARGREWVEIEEEWVGDKLKAVTAYYGGLVDGV